MGALLAVLGAGLLVLVMYDVVVTTVASTVAAGPISQRISRLLWRGARASSSDPDDVKMVAAGPVIVGAIIAAWMLGLWAGWALVFLADPGSVLDASTGQPASTWSKIYYTGFTISTLGTGDFRPDPSQPWWQLLTPLAAINGLTLATLSISYLVPVVTAVNDRRRQAAVIHSLGEHAHEILVRAWDGESFESLDGPLMAIAREIEGTGQRHLTYPVLHFFHGRSRTAAFGPSVAALSEAVVMLRDGVAEEARPPAGLVETVRRSIENMLGIISPEFTGHADEAPPPPSLEPLRHAGIPTISDDEFADAVGELADFRRRLLGFVMDGHWRWENVVPLDRGER